MVPRVVQVRRGDQIAAHRRLVRQLFQRPDIDRAQEGGLRRAGDPREGRTAPATCRSATGARRSGRPGGSGGWTASRRRRMLKEMAGNAAVGGLLHRAGRGKALQLRLHQQRLLPPGGPGRRRGRHGLEERSRRSSSRGSGNVEFHDRSQGRRAEPRRTTSAPRYSQVFQARSKYGTPLTLNVTHTGRNPAHEEFPVRHLGQGPGEDRFGRGLQERQGPPVLPVLLRPLQPDHRGRPRGKYKGTHPRGAGIRDPRHVRVQPPDRFAAHRHPGQRPAATSWGWTRSRRGTSSASSMECFEKGLLTASRRRAWS